MRAILFDAGNTLVQIDYAAIAAQLAVLGVTRAPEEIRRAEWRARVRVDAELFGGRPVSTESRTAAERYLELVLEGVGVVDAATAGAMHAWRRDYNPPYGIFTVAEPAAAPALSRARAAGLVTGVISNSNGALASLLGLLGLLSRVDFVVDSGVVGVEKPDPRIFGLALERARVAAADAVYVGDLYSIDVLGARRAGIGGILIDPGGYWGARDCPAVVDVAAAVELVVGAAAAGA